MLYRIFACFFTFWPAETPVTLESFNWAPVIFVAVVAIAMISYFVKGRHVYDGPVALIKQA